jgi:hypothetical protein
MSTVTLEQIVEEGRTLTPEKQQPLRDMLNKEARLAELRRIQAKYAHLTTSSEVFAARKEDEIEMEDRR